ncbi:hypothetical protein SNEBB_005775 [Seison nebaliae]|nr:hypothetical protein SNEBB_005775 [Seison nebaliae]
MDSSDALQDDSQIINQNTDNQVVITKELALSEQRLLDFFSRFLADVVMAENIKYDLIRINELSEMLAEREKIDKQLRFNSAVEYIFRKVKLKTMEIAGINNAKSHSKSAKLKMKKLLLLLQKTKEILSPLP